FAEVLPELALGCHEEDEAVARAIVLVAHRLLHAVVADGAPGPLAVSVVARHLVLGPLVGLVALDAVPVEGCRPLALGDLEPAPLARRAGADDGRTDAERCVERARIDPDGRVGRDGRQAVVGVARARDAGPRIVRDPMARHVLVRPGHAVARVRAEDDP